MIEEMNPLISVIIPTLMGISTATLRNWEQGRRKPEGPARVLLQVAAKHPNALLDLARVRKPRKKSQPAGREGR